MFTHHSHIFVEPEAGIRPVARFIEKARGELGIDIYYLADRQILRAIHQAILNGVITYVILEQHPYRMSSRLVAKEVDRLRAIGAHVKFAPDRFDTGYRFNHIKIAITAGAALIGTANWDYSAFHRNREYLYVTRSPTVVAALQTLFHADWLGVRAHARAAERAAGLVVSPGSTGTIVHLIETPGPVEIETEELGADPAILHALEAKGRFVRMILPARLSRTDMKNVAAVRRAGVHVRLMPVRPIYMHAKAIEAGRVAFVGSENFSISSLTRNREAGILLRDPTELQILKRQFDRDWTRAGRGPAAGSG
ncbi:MAG: phospholipase D-like domain-containing protein [Acidiphilium sp.]|nr:phospholipase D-like domain-containing protein [Acidiphilium sp.]